MDRLEQLDNCGKNAYNHNDFTAATPQQYSDPSCPQRGPRLLRGTRLTPEEGQRRSGGGNAHGPLPVPGGAKEVAGRDRRLEFGWHHEAMSAIVPKTVLGGQRSF